MERILPAPRTQELLVEVFKVTHPLGAHVARDTHQGERKIHVGIPPHIASRICADHFPGGHDPS